MPVAGGGTKQPQAAGDPLYTAASDYLKTIGFTNLAEISRVLDIATNPNSILLGRMKNANVSIHFFRQA